MIITVGCFRKVSRKRLPLDQEASTNADRENGPDRTDVRTNEAEIWQRSFIMSGRSAPGATAPGRRASRHQEFIL
jgi:hypothetical protein